MKTLDRLLYLQGGECFFCGKQLPKSDASIEHLVASANGGTNAEDNCVACCKTLNALLGSRSLKEKIEVILRQKGTFKCPADLDRVVELQPATPQSLQQKPAAPKQAAPVPKPTAPGSNGGKPSQPIQPQRLNQASPNPPHSPPVAKPPGVTEASTPSAGHTMTCPTCHFAKVPASPGQLDFRCPKCNGAFRY
ncbi:MAG: hypothetical protein JNM37_07265 [Rhodocyclaceae bacterium]|nr:hypothetical protein [Rhodocyclaceae bacterium]